MSSSHNLSFTVPVSFNASTLQEAIAKIDNKNIRHIINDGDEPLATNADIAMYLYNYFPEEANKICLADFIDYNLSQYEQNDGSYIIQHFWDEDTVRKLLSDTNLKEHIEHLVSEYSNNSEIVYTSEFFKELETTIIDFAIDNDYANENIFFENHYDPYIFNKPSIWQDNVDFSHFCSDWFYQNVKIEYRMKEFFAIAFIINAL